MSISLLPVPALLSIACALAAADGTTATERAPLLQRPIVVGASVGAGFGATVGRVLGEGDDALRVIDMAEVLRAALADDRGPIPSEASTWLFTDAPGRGAEQIAAATAHDATLVVGVDFLFWFGYGPLPVHEPDPKAARLAKLEDGLALLEELDCPVVVGDFPDMRGASTTMLPPQLIPAPEILQALNARLAAWAAARPDRLVVPLAQTVERLRAGQTPVLGGVPFRIEGDPRLLQADGLHPTLEGLVLMVALAREALVDAGLTRREEWNADPEAVLARLKKR